MMTNTEMEWMAEASEMTETESSTTSEDSDNGYNDHGYDQLVIVITYKNLRIFYFHDYNDVKFIANECWWSLSVY